MDSSSQDGDATGEGLTPSSRAVVERAESAVHRIARLATKLLSARIALVATTTTGRAKVEAAIGMDVAAFPRELPLHDATLAHESVLYVLDASRDPRLARHSLVANEPFIRFFAGAPLRASDGRVLGSLCVMDGAARDSFTDDDSHTLRDLAAMVAAHVDARQAIGHTAPVTGLANRLRLVHDVDAFIESIGDEDLGRHRLTIAVVETATPHEYSELIRVFGPACADAFERASSTIIRQVIPPSARLYHLSVGRFACVFTEDDEPGLDEVFAALFDAVATPTSCDGVPVTGSPAFGVSRFPDDARSGDELFRAATTAVHDARERGFRWSHYDALQDRAYRRAFAILTDLPKALATSSEQPLELHYQPKIDLTTGICAGAEALVRWTHADLGAIPPIEFVTLAERTELIHPLTEWVIASSFRQLTSWRRTGINLRVAINISMRDLERSEFPNVVAGLMEEHGVEPDWFEFEVTESVLMESHKSAREQLDALESLGVEIAIDDFGTGQSGLAYLKHLPARVLKIDQIFVRGLTTDLNDQHIVRSTIALAHDLGCKVVAEGIETPETCYWLADRGCDYGQGYAISRPLPPKAFTNWLADRAERLAKRTSGERRVNAWPLSDVVADRPPARISGPTARPLDGDIGMSS